MDALDCAVRLSLTFLYLLLSANIVDSVVFRLELKSIFQIVGGDNATESEVNRTKSQLRRTNALGRGNPANAHVDQLSARRLLKQPEFVECAQCHWQRQRK